MRKSILALIFLIGFTAAFYGCSIQQDVPPDPVPPVETPKLIAYSTLGGVFGIANETGDRLITFTPITPKQDAELTYMEGLDVAVGAGGKYLHLEFVKKQDKNDQDTGRVIASNFNNMEGYVYNVLEEKVIPNETYFISKKELVPEKNLLVSSLIDPTPLSAEVKTTIGDLKGRPVKEGWILADYGEVGQIQIVVFEAQGQNYLMSILLKAKDGSMKFMDYPAVSPDGFSVWRVDDGGSISPNLFAIRLAAITDQGFVAIVSWAGAEGENTFFLLEQQDAFQEQPASVSRYWSPA